MSRLAFLVLALGTAVFAAPINIFSTGQSVAEGAVDPNWIITSPAGSAFVTVTDAFPIGFWMPNTATSKWVEPVSGLTDSHAPSTTFTYRTTFNMSGLILSTATLTFRAAGDNEIRAARFNGVDLGFTHFSFSAFSTDRILTSGFLSGSNTLEFDVFNVADSGATPGVGNPTGLRIEVFGSADPFSDPNPDPSVPEPATVGLIAAGLGVLALVRRSR